MISHFLEPDQNFVGNTNIVKFSEADELDPDAHHAGAGHLPNTLDTGQCSPRPAPNRSAGREAAGREWQQLAGCALSNVVAVRGRSGAMRSPCVRSRQHPRAATCGHDESMQSTPPGGRVRSTASQAAGVFRAATRFGRILARATGDFPRRRSTTINLAGSAGAPPLTVTDAAASSSFVAGGARAATAG